MPVSYSYYFICVAYFLGSKCFTLTTESNPELEKVIF